MTMNIWNSGAHVKDGLHKVAKHIQLLDPDIVALQELDYGDVTKNLTQWLGPKWTSHVHSFQSYPDTGVITKHKILVDEVGEVWAGVGVPVAINKGFVSVVVNLWSMHLDYTSYGPYAANNKQCTNASQIMAGETVNGGRVPNMQELLNNTQFNNMLKQTRERPLLVCGDFNSPSHLDWTERTKNIHGGWTFEWPATKMLMDYANVSDSFRTVHQDVLEQPGITWSTVNRFNYEWQYTIPEPLDRIDFIFYKGEKLKPVDSFTYSGQEPLAFIPNQWNNDYPSDHYAVVTDFNLSLGLADIP